MVASRCQEICVRLIPIAPKIKCAFVTREYSNALLFATFADVVLARYVCQEVILPLAAVHQEGTSVTQMISSVAAFRLTVSPVRTAMGTWLACRMNVAILAKELAVKKLCVLPRIDKLFAGVDPGSPETQNSNVNHLTTAHLPLATLPQGAVLHLEVTCALAPQITLAILTCMDAMLRENAETETAIAKRLSGVCKLTVGPHSVQILVTSSVARIPSALSGLTNRCVNADLVFNQTQHREMAV
jgi:hypothetical protein